MNGTQCGWRGFSPRWLSGAGLAFFSSLLLTGAAGAGEINVTVTNLSVARGQVVVAAFASPDTFGELGRDVADIRIPVTGGTVQGILTGLPDGVYALAAYHDKNGNGKMDFNAIGIPKEDYAFSNNVYGVLKSKPSFESATVRVSGGATTVAIRMQD